MRFEPHCILRALGSNFDGQLTGDTMSVNGGEADIGQGMTQRAEIGQKQAFTGVHFFLVERRRSVIEKPCKTIACQCAFTLRAQNLVIRSNLF